MTSISLLISFLLHLPSQVQDSTGKIICLGLPTWSNGSLCQGYHDHIETQVRSIPDAHQS